MTDSGAPVDPDTAADVTGMVVDVRGNRLQGAELSLGPAHATSARDGVFDLGKLAVGEKLTLVATLAGYSTGRVP